MMTWNGTGPYNPNIDPITYSEFLEMSFHEVQAKTAMGMPGVFTWNFGEAFSHLYLDSVAMNHNSIGRGYETWGNGSAGTMKRSIPKTALTMEWYWPVPPPSAAVVWSAATISIIMGNRLARCPGLRRAQFERDASALLQNARFLAQRT